MKRTCTWITCALSISALALLIPGWSAAQADEHGQHRRASFIDRHDTDGDGLVSLDEFTAAFNEMDANGDGFIDSDEAPAPPPRRGGHGRRGGQPPATGQGGSY